MCKQMWRVSTVSAFFYLDLQGDFNRVEQDFDFPIVESREGNFKREHSP